MGMKYYKRSHPTANLYIDGGRTQLRFTSIDGNVTGYFATDVESVQAGLALLISQGSGGITEIEPSEFFRDYVDKKKAGIVSGPVWRDELTANRTKVSPSELAERLRQVAPDVAAVSAPVAQSLTATEASPETAKQPTAPAKPFTPPIGTRKAKAKPPAA